MPAWIYALAVVGVLWSVFVAVFHPFRRGAHAAPRALPVARVELAAVGSMSLADEWSARFPPRPRPMRANPEPWLTAPLGHIHNGSCTDERCWDGGPGRKPVGPYGGQLGPRARDVLDQYEARRLACWGF